MKQTNLGATIAPIAGTTTGRSVKTLSRHILAQYATLLSQLLDEDITPRRALLITLSIGSLMVAVISAILLLLAPFALSMVAFVGIGTKAGMFPTFNEKGGLS